MHGELRYRSGYSPWLLTSDALTMYNANAIWNVALGVLSIKEMNVSLRMSREPSVDAFLSNPPWYKRIPGRP